MAEMTAREVLKLVLDDETIPLDKAPRSIDGFDQLLEKMDRLCDAITHRNNGEGSMEGEEYGDNASHTELMTALTENIQALREIAHTHPEPTQNDEMQKLLHMIAKNTMRRERSWEFDIQRDRRTGFTDKIIAKPVGA